MCRADRDAFAQVPHPSNRATMGLRQGIMVKPQRDYYDKWFAAGLDLKHSSHHAVLYETVLSRIPPDASCVLDAGCGDGAVLDRLPDRHRAVGIDFSLEALRRVHSRVACASIGALCFANGAFDCVICTEVLEHLPHDVLSHATLEIARVSRRHCIISVPNRERLQFGRRTCPACRSSLHAHGHLQRFDPDRLASLLPGFSMQEVHAVGPGSLDFPPWLIKLRRMLAGEPMLDGGRECAVCGHRAGAVRTVQHDARAGRARRAAAFLARRRPNWLVAVYERQGTTVEGDAPRSAPTR
jgi:SAM-dependent methyltransferase